MQPASAICEGVERDRVKIVNQKPCQTQIYLETSPGPLFLLLDSELSSEFNNPILTNFPALNVFRPEGDSL